jgi:hypothetical protein
MKEQPMKRTKAGKGQLVKTEKLAAPEAALPKDINQLFAQAIDKNVAVETMEKLLSMRQQLKSEWARERYHTALAAFQQECPIIKKTKIVMNKDGKTERYRYAPLDSILNQVRDLIAKHGFNYHVAAAIEGRAVTATCIATHKDGHSEQSSFTVPIDPDAYMNEAQKFASALTFSKRYSFIDVFGILTGDEDDDAVKISVTAESKIGHRRTKAYEEVTGEGDPKASADLLNLKAKLTEYKIPDGFLLELLRQKKLIDGHTTNVAQLKPGIVSRVLGQKSMENLVKAWAAHKADEDSGSATAPKPTKSDDRSPFDAPTKEEMAPPKGKVDVLLDGEVRTNEGDQSVRRKPVSDEIASADLLEQEGYENWRQVAVHFGKKKGNQLGKMTAKDLLWWVQNWTPEKYKGAWNTKDLLLDAALVLASEEMEGAQ